MLHMRYFRLVAFFLTLLCYSCKKTSDGAVGPSFPAIDSISAIYEVDPEGIAYLTGRFSAPGRYPIYFVYDNHRRLVKRIGAVVTDIISVYTTAIYDTVIYKTPGDLLLTTISNSSYWNPPPGIREIFFTGSKMTEKILYHVERNSTYYNDTIWYSYDGNDRLSNWKIHSSDEYEESNLTYDDRGNLTQVVNKLIDPVTLRLFVQPDSQKFAGYDHAANPLKGLCLWDDLLYRSLSNNNFTEYSYFAGSNGWDLTSWQLNYLPNGQVDFSH